MEKRLEFDRGEAKLTYDPTLKNPIRIRPASGTTFDTEGARNRLADMIETLSTAGAPFHVSFLKARVRQISREPYPLDLMRVAARLQRSEAHTSELQSLMRLSYAVFGFTKKKKNTKNNH